MFLDLQNIVFNLSFNNAWAEDIFKLIFFIACLQIIFLFTKIIVKWRV